MCIRDSLDTQPTGGKFDGVYGVLAGLEVLRTLDEAGIETEAPLEVVVWTNEGATSLPNGAKTPAALSASTKWAICLRAALGVTLTPHR